MEFVILGLLLFKPMTAYEISSFIGKNLALICSGSAGSVQTALKKLIKNNAVTVNEFVEGSINKKVYSITYRGRSDFDSWIIRPMQMEKVKNMELSKLFFLGFAEKENQIMAIKDYIKQLETAKTTLLAIKNNFISLQESVPTSIREFQAYTLEYGIDSADYEIKWYTKLLKKMGN